MINQESTRISTALPVRSRLNPHKGKPLELEAYFKAPKETRAVNKFLADAGFKPPKLQALAELREKEQAYTVNPSEELRQEVIQARLRYNVLR